MLKTFLVSILSFVMVFVCQSNSWAEIKSSTKFADTITLEPPTITDSDRDKMVAKQSKINLLRSTWVASIFLPGLGQMLMGDFESGLFYMALLNPLTLGLISIITSLLHISFSENTTVGFFNGMLLMSIYLVLYFMNLTDALNLSTMKVREEEAKEISFIRNNIRISNNGLEVKVFSF